MAKEALESGEADAHVDKVGEFFRNRVAGFILVPWHRLVLGAILLGWTCIAIWQATELQAIQQAEQFLDEDHPLQKSFTILENGAYAWAY